jgi:transcriptional regulator with XRE-family HTH domain
MQATAHQPANLFKTMVYDGRMPRMLSQKRPQQGARLVELRKAANLSQIELAELVGESQTNIAYWERSDKPPRSDVLTKLAEVLGVEVADLLGIEAKKPRRAGPVGKVRQLFDAVSALPRREQNMVVQMVSAIVNDYKSRAG